MDKAGRVHQPMMLSDLHVRKVVVSGTAAFITQGGRAAMAPLSSGMRNRTELLSCRLLVAPSLFSRHFSSHFPNNPDNAAEDVHLAVVRDIVRYQRVIAEQLYRSVRHCTQSSHHATVAEGDSPEFVRHSDRLL